MKYIDLLKIVKYPIFSLQDLKILNVKVYPYQLSIWVKKGYLLRLKNGLFIFSDRRENIKVETVAFNLYQPSYVSMEWVLSKYGIIPEMTYNCTSITTKTTRNFKNEFGYFSFRHIKRNMFFGYKKIEENGQVYLIAEPEKALIDYIYLNSKKIKSQEDIKGLRLNEDMLNNLNKNKIKKYMKIINNKKTLEILNTILC